MTARRLRVAYVPLTDAAPLIVAEELGFAAGEGLALELLPMPSWARLRDALGTGEAEAAHMLAPMPVARALGLGPALPGIEALMVLSQGGQAIGASRAVVARLGPAGVPGGAGSPRALAAALAALGPLRVGVPFPFSTHALLVSRWLGPDPAAEIRTVPPSRMAEALRAGEIDLFCVGEPWGSVAAEEGAGGLLLSGRAIWAAAPEKVLAVRAGWAEAEPAAARGLMRAVWRAGRWLDAAGNRSTAAEILARPDYLNLPAEVIERGLLDRLGLGTGAAGRFASFHEAAATFPWRSVAMLMGDWLARARGLRAGPARAAAAATFRSDLYRQNLREAGAELPLASAKVEGSLPAATAVRAVRGEMILGPDCFFDGQTFDPAAG